MAKQGHSEEEILPVFAGSRVGGQGRGLPASRAGHLLPPGRLKTTSQLSGVVPGQIPQKLELATENQKLFRQPSPR